MAAFLDVLHDDAITNNTSMITEIARIFFTSIHLLV